MKLLVSTNQYPAAEAHRAHELKADGVWSLPGNSPGITNQDTQAIINNIGGRLVVVEEGGINPEQLLDTPNWTGQPAHINGQRTLTRSAGFNPSRAMVYYEFSHPNVLQCCLNVEELKRAYTLEGNTPLLVLTRDWTRAQRARVKDALTLPKRTVAGVTFEIEANVPLIRAQQIVQGIRYMHSVTREAWVLLSPKNPSNKFEFDVHDTLTYLKRNLSPEIWRTLRVAIGVYEVDRKGTSFFGATNSMLAAIKVARKFR